MVSEGAVERERNNNKEKHLFGLTFLMHETKLEILALLDCISLPIVLALA